MAPWQELWSILWHLAGRGVSSAAACLRRHVCGVSSAVPRLRAETARARMTSAGALGPEQWHAVKAARVRTGAPPFPFFPSCAHAIASRCALPSRARGSAPWDRVTSAVASVIRSSRSRGWPASRLSAGRAAWGTSPCGRAPAVQLVDALRHDDADRGQGARIAFTAGVRWRTRKSRALWSSSAAGRSARVTGTTRRPRHRLADGFGLARGVTQAGGIRRTSSPRATISPARSRAPQAGLIPARHGLGRSRTARPRDRQTPGPPEWTPQNDRSVAIDAVAATEDGAREVRGVATGPSEAETFRTEFLRSTADRGLRACQAGECGRRHGACGRPRAGSSTRVR